jgi:hypothetical protein
MFNAQANSNIYDAGSTNEVAVNENYIVYYKKKCPWCCHLMKLLGVLDALRFDLQLRDTWFITEVKMGEVKHVPSLYDPNTRKVLGPNETFDFILSLLLQSKQMMTAARSSSSVMMANKHHQKTNNNSMMAKDSAFQMNDNPQTSSNRMNIGGGNDNNGGEKHRVSTALIPADTKMDNMHTSRDVNTNIFSHSQSS